MHLEHTNFLFISESLKPNGLLNGGIHGSVVTWKEETLKSSTSVHVFNIANQDATTSAAVLQDTLSRIKDLNTAIHNVCVRSENAGCYHSVYGIGVVPCINKKNSNAINIKHMDFCDPQGGKSICDGELLI